MAKDRLLTREEVVTECKRLKAAIAQSQSNKLRADYDKRLRRLQKRLLYQETEM